MSFKSLGVSSLPNMGRPGEPWFWVFSQSDPCGKRRQNNGGLPGLSILELHGLFTEQLEGIQALLTSSSLGHKVISYAKLIPVVGTLKFQVFSIV